jgi:hypothetical protein
MRSGRRVDQLRADAHAATGFTNGAFEDVAHTQFAADLLQIDRMAFVRKARIAGDDQEPPDAGERDDDLIDHAVGEIFLLGVAAHVLEGHHRQGWFIGQWQRATRPERRRICHDPRHRRGKAIATPPSGENAAPLCLSFVEDPAERRDLHVEIAVFDCGLRPDCGNHLRPRDEFPRPLNQYAENAECTRAQCQRDENAALIPSGQDPAPSIEAKPPEKANVPGGRCVHATTSRVG